MNGYVNIRQDIADFANDCVLNSIPEGSKNLPGAYTHLHGIFKVNKPIYMSSDNFRGVVPVTYAGVSYHLALMVEEYFVFVHISTDDTVTVEIKSSN